VGFPQSFIQAFLHGIDNLQNETIISRITSLKRSTGTNPANQCAAHIFLLTRGPLVLLYLSSQTINSLLIQKMKHNNPPCF
jgi:hypothetical protein